MTTTVQPVRLAQTQIKPVIASMGRAFINDPFLRYLAPDEAKWVRLTPQIY